MVEGVQQGPVLVGTFFTADAVRACAAVSACRRNFFHGNLFHRKFVVRRIISSYDESLR